jgi:hypothetical protein
MNKISIAFIIICTAIIAAAVFFSFQKNPGIGDIYLVSSENIEGGSIEDKGVRDFSSRDSSIYAIIPVTDIKTSDQLHVVWVFLGEDGNEIIQRDDIKAEDTGSGTIAVYLLKADSAYRPGNYSVRVDYNGIMEKQLSFAINES